MNPTLPRPDIPSSVLRHPARDAAQGIAAISVVICLALTVTFVGSLVILGLTLYERSASDARNMAVALQQYALRLVTTGELVAQSARDHLVARGTARGLPTDRFTHDLLADLTQRLPGGSGIVIVDRSGTVVSSFHDLPAPPVDLSDREWYHRQFTGSPPFLVTEALLSRVTKGKVFLMSMAARDPEGDLIGVVNLGVPSDALMGEQALPPYGGGIVLTLLLSDGSLLARSDFPDELLGTRYPVTGHPEDRVTFQPDRDVDRRMAIEATDYEPRYGLIARASVPLTTALRPVIPLAAVGLPLLVAMLSGTIALARALARQHRALEQTTARLQAVFRASHLGAWHYSIPSGVSEMNEGWARIVGHESHEIAQSTTEWSNRLHPDEKTAVEQALADALADKTPVFHMEHRLRHKSGHWVWVLDSGCVVERDEAGKPLVMTGTLLDISQRHEVEHKLRVLMRELDHRSKNLLAVVYSLINLMPDTDLATFKRALLGRVKALGHVHTLLSDAAWRGVDLASLIATETGAYRIADPPAVSAEGPPLTLRPAAAQALAMIVHELMTNSAKYGALSAPAGRVRIEWGLSDAESGTFSLIWSESGGPPVTPPLRQGFGSTLLAALVRDQIDGQLRSDWAESGAVFTITAPAPAIIRPEDAGDEAFPGDRLF